MTAPPRTSEPLVSVVIPAHNAARFIRDTLESALAQTYPHVEVIVVDDGSTEPMRAMVDAYGDRVRYVVQDHRGPSSARNRGIQLSKGEYIAFLDADDLWVPDKLEAQVDLLERQPRMGLVYSAVTRIDNDGQPCAGGDSRRPGPSGRIVEALFMQNFIPTSTVIVRKACFNAVGLFEGTAGAVPGQDYDMWLRIAERYDVAFVPRPLAKYRVHAAGISKRTAQAYQAEQAVVNRTLERHGGPRGEWRRLVRRRYGQLHFEWGEEYFSNGEYREARTQFRKSLRWTPWRLRVSGYWLSTLFGWRAVAALRRLKRTRNVHSVVRVLHLLNTLDTGGAERVVLNLAMRIDRGRFTLLVCSLGGAGDLAGEFRRLGVPVFAMHRRAGIDPSLWIRLARLCRRERIDVLHTHNATPWLYGGLAARLAGTVLCHTEHSNLFPRQRALMTAERVLARFTRVVFAVSDKVRRQLVEQQGLPTGKVVAVVNGIETNATAAGLDVRAARAALGLNGAQQVIGTVGRLVPVKDHGTLLAAFQRVLTRFPAARLVIVGDGPERGRLARRAAELGIAERVMWLGQRRDVRELLQVFDVFVLSSVSEGMPLTVLEAMAAGKPVVATNVGGVREAVVNGTTGLLVPPSSPERLADAVEVLLADRAMRHAFGDRARRRAEERFDLSGMVRQYEAAYYH